MQLVAHSVVPSNPVPYLHLGYISAIPFQNSEPAIIMAVICLFVAVKAGKQRPVLCLIFAILTCLSITAVPIFWHQGVLARDRIINRSKTYTSARVIIATLDMAAQDGIETPVDLTILKQKYDCETSDAWGRPFRLVKQGKGNQIHYIICSDGPDKTPDTKDDLSWPYEPPKKDRASGHLSGKAINPE